MGGVEHEAIRPQNVCPECGERSDGWVLMKDHRAMCPRCGHVCGQMQRKRYTPAERVEAAERKKQRRRDYEAANRERVNLRGRLRRRRMTPQQLEDARAKHREVSRRWYASHKEQAARATKAWRHANPEKARLKCKRYRLRKLRERKEQA